MTIISRRGVFLPSHKKETLRKPIEPAVLPERLAIPLFLYGENDNSCVPTVSEDCRVRRYDTVAKFASGFHAVAPVDATVREIRKIDGRPYLILEPDREQGEPAFLAPYDPKAILENEILERADRASVTAGGQPISEVLRSYQKKEIIHLWADAICDEPYSTARIELLRTRGEDIASGLRLAARAVGAQPHGFLISAFSSRGLPERLDELPVQKVLGKYPLRQRAAKQLSQTNGAMLGADALLALYEAVALGKGQGESLVTLNGNRLTMPKNRWVVCGTPVLELFDECGMEEEPDCFLLGDALTGRLAHAEEPVALGTDTALAFVTDRIKKRVCINCGRCVERCPQKLFPTEIARALDAKEDGRLLLHKADACTGCGVCSYVCPVGIDLTVKTKAAARRVFRMLEEQELAEAQRTLPNAVPEQPKETDKKRVAFGRDDMMDPVSYEKEKEAVSFLCKKEDNPSGKKAASGKKKSGVKRPAVSKKAKGKAPGSAKKDAKAKPKKKSKRKGAEK